MAAPAAAHGHHVDYDSDAHALKKAMKGLGTDEDVLIEILANRTKEELGHIIRAYEHHYHTALAKDIEDDTSGNFKKLLIGLATPVPEYKARALHHAMAGAGTREGVLIDVLTQSTNWEINEMKHEYEKLYGKKSKKTGDHHKPSGKSKLEKDVASETSFNFKKCLMELLKGDRQELPYGAPIDAEEASRDAQHFYKAGEGRLGTDDDTYVRLLSKKSVWYNVAVDHEYSKLYKHGLETAIKKETSGDYMRTLLALITPPDVYWAERFHAAIAGLGTNDSLLVYGMIVHEKWFLRQISEVYNKKYGETLVEAIKGDTSGDYKKLLLELLK